MKLAFALVALAACSHAQPDREAQRAKNAIDLAPYQQALDDCRERGKLTKDYATYENCALEADRKFGKDAGK